MAIEPAISVVMPVFNGERFVAAAVESILGQTLGDFEFIIIDDGSVDGTAEILARYARADPRVQVHRQPNQGVTVALNNGIRKSRAPLIARMDADDVSLPHRFERQLRHLNANPDISVLGSWFYSIDEQSQRGFARRYPEEPGLVAWSMLFYNSLAHPTVMMRRDALDTNAAYSDEYKNIEQDYELFSRLSFSKRLANLQEPLLLYRTWGGNVSKKADRANVILRNVLIQNGYEMTEDDATAVLGLARDRYPSDPDQIRRLAAMITTLQPRYVRRFAGSTRDVRAINGDAAMRLWLLAALSLRRSPALAVSLAAAATRVDPSSFVTFGSKVLARVGARLSLRTRVG